MYNVLIVEDQEMPRQLFEIFVKSSEIFQLAGSVSDAASAAYFCKNNKVDLVLMDVITNGGNNGLNAAEEIKKTMPEIKDPVFDADQIEHVRLDKEQALAPLTISNGINPLELEEYVRKVNQYHVGIHKTEDRLKRALELFARIQDQFIPFLGASNPHELMRTQEVKHILDTSILHAQASLIRTESRYAPAHYRIDYPETDNENWMKAIVWEYKDGKATYTLEDRG